MYRRAPKSRGGNCSNFTVVAAAGEKWRKASVRWRMVEPQPCLRASAKIKCLHQKVPGWYVRSFLFRVQKVVSTCFPILITILVRDCPIRQIVASDPRHQITFMANWRAHTGGHIWRTFVTHLEHIANGFLTHWSTKTLIAHLCNIYPAHFMLILLN